ncbi:MAG: DUF3828 domain-containing protein [Candidatus Dadabacteria bacterium]|nr:DUF3828 domain-containing protein [Candidatus Dadabacteria bacterium]
MTAKRMLDTIFICVFTLSIAACSKVGDKGPADTVGGFYDAYIKVKPLGIPGAEKLARLSPYLAPGLVSLLKEADLTEKKYKEETKGEAPPLVEGDVFTSLFEGADAFQVGECEEKDDSAECEVGFSNTNPGDGKTFKWKDAVLLEKTDKGWLISDVDYKGDWDFAVKGALTEMLKRLISEEPGD